MTDAIGNIVSGVEVEEAVEDAIRTWLPTYLAEIERQTGRDPETLATFRSYTHQTEFDKWPEDQLPCCIIVSPGTEDSPGKEGNGQMRATWGFVVAMVVSARDQESTNRLVKHYAAAVRALLIQHKPVIAGSLTRGFDWVNEAYDEMPPEEAGRTLAAARLAFTMEIDQVTSSRGGPRSVPADPYAAPDSNLTVQTTTITATIGEDE